jgi:lipopolysaccharide assembly protein A
VRWVHLTIIVLLAAATVIFTFQNLGTVTISFLSIGFRAPIAILILVVYVSGALTGGSLFCVIAPVGSASAPQVSAAPGHWPRRQGEERLRLYSGAMGPRFAIINA